ncbi:uncharacterized protein LOC111606787 isoform X2 [Xiphophorus maculatus]|nr:uncharacterized protein LOC111606787 isoform X2 [Xiphophorus maculatus]XP_023183836.1 uncharacterized protein LOC111606787 isoform X2 [Xiphophorus maculatus]
MGTPYARWIFYCAVTTVCLMFGEGSEPEFHPHDYSTNLWWKLMNRTAYEGHAVNCYVCAQLPVSIHNSGLRPGNITDDKQMCLYVLSTRPRRVPPLRGDRPREKDYSADLRMGEAVQGLFQSLNCSLAEDVLPFSSSQQTVWKIPEIISLAGAKPGSLGNCVYNNGNVFLGTLPWNLCNRVYTYCEPTQDYITCVACRGQRMAPHCKGWKENPDCDNLLQERSFNITHKMKRRQETTLCSAIVPGDYGSRMLSDWYFICGNEAYMFLPKNWGGLCAVVPLINPIAFIRKAQDDSHTRSKRTVMSEVKRWGGLTTHTGVPWEFRIWNGGEKFMQSLFPWVGIGEIRDHVEINRYGLLRLINITYQLANGTMEELTELRNMVMQNRVVLDFLTAPQGGVCKIIGPTCCTFVPDETGTGGTISDALYELEDLKQYVESGTRGSTSFDLFSWLTSGPWWNLLLKLVTPILVVLVLFCLFTGCIIPCLRKMMFKTINTTVISYQLAKASYETTEDDLFQVSDDFLNNDEVL